MSKYDEKWWLHFIPECYFDTVVLKKLLDTKKRVLHKRGSNNVVAEFENGKLQGDFAVGLIDKDKKEVGYLKQCSIIREEEKFFVWKHHRKPHYIIQINPPLEKWIIEILTENGLFIENFDYPKDYKKLKASIRDDIKTENDVKLNRLVDAIIATNCETIVTLKIILQYLKETNYNADITTLRTL